MKRASVLIFLLVLGATLLWGAMWAARWLAVDACLDRGGRWDYEMAKCST